MSTVTYMNAIRRAKGSSRSRLVYQAGYPTSRSFHSSGSSSCESSNCSDTPPLPSLSERSLGRHGHCAPPSRSLSEGSLARQGDSKMSSSHRLTMSRSGEHGDTGELADEAWRGADRISATHNRIIHADGRGKYNRSKGRASRSFGTLKLCSTCKLWLRESCCPGHRVSHESASMAALA